MDLTLESINARCEEVGDCLLWTGRVANGSPQLFVVDATSRTGKRYVMIRRAVHELTTGKPLAMRLHPVMKCRDPLCVSFEHMALLSTKAISQLAAKEGRLSTPQRRAAISAGARKSPNAKLTAEDARAIRLSDEPGPVLAERYGVHRSLIPRIKRGEAWAEATRGASVFNLGV